MHIYVNNKKIFFNKYKTKCAIGKRGISANKIEGDFKTPKGKFPLEYLLYRKDRIKKIETNLKKVVIKKNMGWCDDPTSKKYNQLIRMPFKYSAENLFRKDKIYDLLIVIGYNRKKIKKNKGSAIFLHLASKYFRPTAGCIAVQKNVMIAILKSIDRKSKIVIK